MKYLPLLASAALLLAVPAAAQHQTTLFDSTQVTMEESGLSHVVNHQRIRLNDYKACRNNSALTLDYDPQSAYVEYRKVLVHRANGTTETVVDGKSKGTVYDYVAPARLIYWGASQKMVQIGHLDPGDEIEFWSYRKGFTYALLQNDDDRYIPPMRGHFYDIVPFWSTDSVALKVYTISLPASKQLQYKVYNGTLDTLVNRTADQQHLQFTKRGISPVKREPNALAYNDIACKLLLSTAPHWQSKSQWFYGVNEDYGSFNATPEVKQMVDKLLANAKSEIDSISILTHWVADNIRYCGISMGEGEGYTLHNAEMNFTDRCGVCKDKAGMLIAMLRAAGFKAYAAMTMAGERIEDIPADQFNHSVAVVQRSNGAYQLLDPTWVPNVRELWSSAEQQQGYLMGLPEGSTLMYTSTSQPINHYFRVKASSEIKRNGTLVGKLTITAEGQSDRAVRGVFSSRMSEWDRNLEAELLRIDPRAKIIDIHYTDNDTYLSQPVSITYEYEIPHYATVTPHEIVFIPITARHLFRRAQGQLNLNSDIEVRSQPFHDNCSRLIEIEESISLPHRYHKMHFPTVEGVAGRHASFGCTYWLEGDVLNFAESSVYDRRVYEPEDWPAFRQTLLEQKKLATTPVILTK